MNNAPRVVSLRTRLKSVVPGIVLLLVLLSPILALYVVAGPAINRRAFFKVRQGMPKADVRRILGTPTDGDGTEVWYYQRWGNFGWAEVHFDYSGRVVFTNDESVFPP